MSMYVGDAIFDSDDLTEMTAIEDDEGYKVITLKLSLTYEGTEISDQFTASGGLGVTQDAEFWSIEYLNSTGIEAIGAAAFLSEY